MRRLVLVLVLLGALAAGACGSDAGEPVAASSTAPTTTAAAPAGFDWQLEERSIGDRRYLVAAPDEGEPRLVVLAFHGKGDDPARMAAMTGLHAVAAANGIATAYLEGVDRAWSDGAAPSSLRPDPEADLRFAEAVAAELGASSVAAVGFSNGAGFALRLAAERPSLVSAVVAVGGQLAADVSLSDPGPALVYHGDADEIWPIEGTPPVVGEPTPFTLTESIGAEPTAARLAAVAGAGERTVVEEAGRTRTRWRGGSAPVDLVVLHGYGHGWPPGATAEIVAFLRDR